MLQPQQPQPDHSVGGPKQQQPLRLSQLGQVGKAQASCSSHIWLKQLGLAQAAVASASPCSLSRPARAIGVAHPGSPFCKAAVLSLIGGLSQREPPPHSAEIPNNQIIHMHHLLLSVWILVCPKP